MQPSAPCGLMARAVTSSCHSVFQRSSSGGLAMRNHRIGAMRLVVLACTLMACHEARAGKDGPRGRFDPPRARPSCSAFSADGKLVAVGFINTFPETKRVPSGRVIKVWDVKTRKELQ